MSKQVKTTLQQVSCDRRGHPRAFCFRAKKVTVEKILDDWEEAGCWWQGERPRRVYKLLGDSGAVYEIHHQAPLGWHLHRLYD